MSDPLADALGGLDNSFGYDPWSASSVNDLIGGFGGTGDFTGDSGGSWWNSALSGINDFSSGLGKGLSSLFGAVTNSGPGYQFPTQAVLGSLVEMLGQNSVNDTLKGMFNDMKTADPWNSQMGRYQQPLYDAATQGIGNTAYGQSVADASARKMASMGYNGSGNQAIDIAKSLNSATPGYMQALTPLAMGRAPNLSGAAGLGLGMGQAQQGLYNSIGYGLQGLLQGASTPPAVQKSSGGGGLGDILSAAGPIASIAGAFL